MIRYFDHIAVNPTAEDVEGKIVFAVGIWDFRSFRKPGRVTRVSGERVYIEPILFEGLGSLNAKNFINLKSVGAICDTEEEAQAILSVNQKAQRSYQAHKRALDLEINGLFNELAVSQGEQADE